MTDLDEFPLDVEDFEDIGVDPDEIEEECYITEEEEENDMNPCGGCRGCHI